MRGNVRGKSADLAGGDAPGGDDLAREEELLDGLLVPGSARRGCSARRCFEGVSVTMRVCRGCFSSP